MSRLPLGVIVFLCCTLVFETFIFFLPEYLLQDLPYEQSALRLKSETADRGGEYDLIILGDCTGWAGIRPKLLEKDLGISAYNFSVNAAQTFMVNYVMLERYLSHARTMPKLVVIQVAANSLLRDFALDFDGFAANVLPYFRMDADMLNELSDPIREEYARYRIMTLVPSIKKQYVLRKDLWLMKLAMADRAAYERYMQTFREEHGFWNEDLDPRKYYLPQMTDKDIIPDYRRDVRSAYNLHYMKKAIEALGRRHIKVVLITSPVRGDELEIRKKYAVQERLAKTIREELGGYGNVLGVLDMSDLLPETKYYSDDIHLNTFGAYKYTTALSEGLKKLKINVPERTDGF